MAARKPGTAPRPGTARPKSRDKGTRGGRPEAAAAARPAARGGRPGTEQARPGAGNGSGRAVRQAPGRAAVPAEDAAPAVVPA
jgi:hypothetical protein